VEMALAGPVAVAVTAVLVEMQTVGLTSPRVAASQESAGAFRSTPQVMVAMVAAVAQVAAASPRMASVAARLVAASTTKAT